MDGSDHGQGPLDSALPCQAELTVADHGHAPICPLFYTPSTRLFRPVSQPHVFFCHLYIFEVLLVRLTAEDGAGRRAQGAVPEEQPQASESTDCGAERLPSGRTARSTEAQRGGAGGGGLPPAGRKRAGGWGGAAEKGPWSRCSRVFQAAGDEGIQETKPAEAVRCVFSK